MRARSLTGIKPTGIPHIGNYLGAIRPALELTRDYDAFYFIADYHAMTITPSKQDLIEQTYAVAATWLAMGLDPSKSVFYRQSDVPEIFELSWLLSCFTPKGFMNRAHGYKDRVAKNQENGADLDDGINMGFYSYPVLMSADILMFNSNVVPVGQDQKQHLEFARDIAGRINTFYNEELLVVPEPKIGENTETVVGLDGRKMSKSYGNTIPLFLPEKALQKLLNKVVTNSQSPEEPKDPDSSYVYAIHKLFLSPEEDVEVRNIYTSGGMGWGKAKSMLFESLNKVLSEPRKKYEELQADRPYIDQILAEGAAKARVEARKTLERVRKAVGVASV